MYGPPLSDSDDDYDGFSFGDQYIKERPVYHTYKTDHRIQWAIEAGELTKMVELMKEKKLDANGVMNNGESMVGFACKIGKLEIVKYLLDNGANPNKQTDSVTVLMSACMNKTPGSEATEVAKLLLAAGAVVNASDKYGNTPFILACKNGHIDIVKMMIDEVSFDACDNQGCTPIFHAIENNRADIVKYLVESGVNCEIANKKGYTPRQVAVFHGFYDILELLPPEKEKPYEVPLTYLSYNNICDMIPRIFLKTECPEYFQDINLILLSVGMAHTLEYFAKGKISLSEFLTMDNGRLEEIGIVYPIHRSRILKGLLNFHLHQWTKRSIARVRKGPPENFYEILVLTANHLQNLIIITSTLKYVKHNLFEGNFGPISREVVDMLRHHSNCYKVAIKELYKTTKYLQSFSPNRPPLYIDFDDYVAEKKRTKFRRIFKYTVFIALSVVICLKVKKVI